jgi:hypothetical protein
MNVLLGFCTEGDCWVGLYDIEPPSASLFLMFALRSLLASHLNGLREAL